MACLVTLIVRLAQAHRTRARHTRAIPHNFENGAPRASSLSTQRQVSATRQRVLGTQLQMAQCCKM